jgi:cell division septum initiation protein DivIVA
MSSPEHIQEEIEHTRASLSRDVDRLGDKVSPGKVVSRRLNRVKNSATSMRDRVMGSPDDDAGAHGVGGAVASAASSAKNAVNSAASNAASSVGDTVTNAPQAARRQAQGNPLAAGLIAFGAGWLLSSLAPASPPEEDLARRAEQKAADLAQPLKDHAQDVAAELQQPLQRSAEEIKSTATDAAQQTAEHARSAAADVREPFQQ